MPIYVTWWFTCQYCRQRFRFHHISPLLQTSNIFKHLQTSSNIFKPCPLIMSCPSQARCDGPQPASGSCGEVCVVSVVSARRDPSQPLCRALRGRTPPWLQQNVKLRPMQNICFLNDSYMKFKFWRRPLENGVECSTYHNCSVLKRILWNCTTKSGYSRIIAWSFQSTESIEFRRRAFESGPWMWSLYVACFDVLILQSMEKWSWRRGLELGNVMRMGDKQLEWLRNQWINMNHDEHVNYVNSFATELQVKRSIDCQFQTHLLSLPKYNRVHVVFVRCARSSSIPCRHQDTKNSQRSKL